MKVGEAIRINTNRPHKSQYSGSVGQITRITNRDVAYVCIGRQTIPFYFDELETVSPVEGGAA